jgi:hypothetical protein
MIELAPLNEVGRAELMDWFNRFSAKARCFVAGSP